MSFLGDWRPRLESPASVRLFLAAAALASVALLIYASLVPLEFRPLAWDGARQAWRQIPWLSLDVYHRADWVANALAVLPASLLAAAAVDWGRPTRWHLLLTAPLITFGLALVVIAIELTQVWFPPRTVSLNDIAAGFVGAALGPPIWAICGPLVESGVVGFFSLPRCRDRLAWLGIGWLAVFALFSLLPLDLVLSSAEWQEKVAAGRLQWIPLSAAIDWPTVFNSAALAAFSLAPIGFACAVLARPRTAIGTLWLVPVLLQLIQLPIFSKPFSTAAIVGGWIGGWTAYWFGKNIDRWADFARRPLPWAIGYGCALVWAVTDLLRGYQRIIHAPDEIQARFDSGWSWPLVRYYANSEYGAYTNLLEKMGIFAAVGLCCAGWSRAVSGKRSAAIVWGSLVAVICLAFGIELVQVFLPPLVPDFSDGLVYLAGYALGYYALVLLVSPATSTWSSFPGREHYHDDSVADLGLALINPHLRETRQRLLWFLAATAILAFAAYGSLVPLNFTPRSFHDAWTGFLNTAKWGADLSSVDWGINAMLLVPAGFCLMAAALRRNASIVARLSWSLAVLALCLTFSVSIELAQSWFPPRVPMVADVAAQTCGAIIGIAVWWICGPAVSRILAEVDVDNTPQNQLGLVLLVYVAGLLFFSLAPLDLTLHPVDLIDKYRDGRILLVPFSFRPDTVWQFVYDLLADVVLFIPVGVFATTFLAIRGGTQRSLAHSLLLGCAIVFGIEALQLVVMSRYTDATDLITGSLGVAIGVYGYRYLRGSSAADARIIDVRNWWLMICLAIYSPMLVAFFWYPFDFDASDSEAVRQRVHDFFGIPFVRIWQGSYAAAVDGVLRKFLLFLPLGILVALLLSRVRWELRAFGLLAAILWIAGTAATIELGQVFLPEHLACFDDVLVCCAGALVGYWTARRFVA